MKKSGVLLMLLLAMTNGNYRVLAQSVTITLMPGWNWISVPMMDTLDFETALGSFTPMPGDIIKSQTSNATYMDNGQWRGPISQFYPGYGYMYKSNRTAPVMVPFSAQPMLQVMVTTSDPTGVTANSAMGSGEVISDGTDILMKGICWAIHENPETDDDFYQEAGSGAGSFTVSMTDLNISTTYYVRAYAITTNGTIYGEEKSFTTLNGIPSITVNELTNGNTISLTDYPKALKKGDKISFSANITSWGEGIIIGKGTTNYTAAYAMINSTQIVLKSYASGTETIHGTVNHGLTLSTYIKVVIDISATKWKFIIQTLTGTFTTEINCSYNNGTPRITSNGAILSDISFSCTNSDFFKPIWMFGDSYFGISTQNRELYWLNEWGYLNTLVQGFAGQSSSGAYADLQKCIAISKPKYIVWCLGMNDNYSVATWQSYIANVREICNTYGITLILSTIPQPLNTTTYKYKDDMSTWIREESNCRYIDVAKAVGSDENGHWYGYGESYDYQSSDNVHPTIYGAKAIATQFLIDFPEIMQY